jgi:hypothetical protein
MADMRNTPGWDPGVVSATKTTDGEVGLGTVFAVVVKAPGRTLTLPYEVVTYEPPTSVVLEARSSGLHSFDRVTVAPAEGGGCSVTYDAELTGTGWLALVNPLLALSFKGIGDRATAGLAKAIGA